MLSDHGFSHIRSPDRVLISPCCISWNVASVACPTGQRRFDGKYRFDLRRWRKHGGINRYGSDSDGDDADTALQAAVGQVSHRAEAASGTAMTTDKAPIPSVDPTPNNST